MENHKIRAAVPDYIEAYRSTCKAEISVHAVSEEQFILHEKPWVRKVDN
jgi:hypothetical protein